MSREQPNFCIFLKDLLLVFIIIFRRKDSQAKGETLVMKTDFSVAARATDVTINPGSNTVALHAKVRTVLAN